MPKTPAVNKKAKPAAKRIPTVKTTAVKKAAVKKPAGEAADGERNLAEIFNRLRTALAKYAPPYTVVLDRPGRYELWSKKDVVVAGRLRKEIFFAGLIIQRDYVGFYYMPVYAETGLTKVFAPPVSQAAQGQVVFPREVARRRHLRRRRGRARDRARALPTARLGLTLARAVLYDPYVRRFVIIFAAVLLAACGSEAPTSSSATPQIPASVDPDLVLCETDADCIAVPAGCCSCLEGGTATAVNKESRLRWSVHRTEECSPGCCSNEPSSDPTCSASPVCVNGMCRLR